VTTSPLPLTFRTAESHQIFAWIEAGESCLVVGIGSVGKSNFLRFLARQDVQAKYLNATGPSHLVIYIDSNKLIERSSWGLFELILHQLLVEVSSQKNAPEAVRELDDLHQRLTNPDTRHLALRYLERGLAIVCHRMGFILNLLLDDFDQLCPHLEPTTFSALRALRDDHKNALSFIVSARRRLSSVVHNLPDLEPFDELVSPNRLLLGTYNEEDARTMLQRLADRRNIQLEEAVITRILAISGRHPGLIRAIFSSLVADPLISVEILANEPSVVDECQRIWYSLDSEQQKGLLQLTANMQARLGAGGLGADKMGTGGKSADGMVIGGVGAGSKGGISLSSGSLSEFERLGLLALGPTRPVFASTLITHFLDQTQLQAGSLLTIDSKLRLVWINGEKMTNLTQLEFRLLEFLYQHPAQVCSRDELAAYLYPKEPNPGGMGINETRLDSVIKRLRSKIEPDPDHPRYLLTVRGHGFKMGDGSPVD
jgi:DNA-binding winged helix-turn-helix (wHTH) protein